MKTIVCDLCNQTFQNISKSKCTLKIPHSFCDTDGTYWYALHKLNICINCMNQILQEVRLRIDKEKRGK